MRTFLYLFLGLSLLSCSALKAKGDKRRELLGLYKDAMNNYHLTLRYNSTKVVNISKQFSSGDTLVVYYRSGVFIKENSKIELTENVKFLKCYSNKKYHLYKLNVNNYTELGLIE